MNPIVAEFIGTMILVLLGNGVVCNVVLAKTKGNNAGWIVITAGWGIAVFCGACIANAASGAHLNPAVTIALVLNGGLDWPTAFQYIGAQMVGAMAGANLVYLFYRSHFALEESADNKLACFATSPAIPGNLQAFFCELVGTFVLILTILHFQAPSIAVSEGIESMGEGIKLTAGLGANQLLPVALLVFGIGLSLGGTTGYAINPARDLGPRIMHQLLPIPGKRDSDWGYALVPILGPIAGAILAVYVTKGL